MDKIIRSANIDDIENRPIDLVIDFSRFLRLTIRVKEIVQCLLTGTTTIQTNFRRCNIVKCKADRWKTIGANLDGVDIKDCFFDDCSFDNTNFSNSATINCNYQSSVFKNCYFKYSSVTNTTFERIIFEKCDLSNLVMEGCRFIDCSFIDCITSNKLIEESLLFNTTFENMSIDICTILNNFGISKLTAVNVNIIDGNGYFMRDTTINEEQLRSLLDYNNISKAHKFKIAYYLNHNLFDDGGIYVDQIFDINTWLEICKNAVTFNNTFSLFYEFLSYNYEHGHITLWPLLKLYNLTSQLSNIPNIEKRYQIYPNIMGIHMAAVRYVEEYYILLQEYIKLHANNPIVLLVCAGPIDRDFYRRRLSPIFRAGGIEIQKVIKHNSPNELFLLIHDLGQVLNDLSFSQLLQDAANFVTVFSAFLMTRKAKQIGKIKQEIKENFVQLQKKQHSVSSSCDNQKIQNNQNEQTTSIAISPNRLNDSVRINIICPKESADTPLNISIENNSHIICTIGNTIIDVLS